jgi:hypothetical protein
MPIDSVLALAGLRAVRDGAKGQVTVTETANASAKAVAVRSGIMHGDGSTNTRR